MNLNYKEEGGKGFPGRVYRWRRQKARTELWGIQEYKGEKQKVIKERQEEPGRKWVVEAKQGKTQKPK